MGEVVLRTADERIAIISEVALLEIASCSYSPIAGVGRTDNYAAEASGGSGSCVERPLAVVTGV
ncbi:proline-rich receptor-like protein kinase PERK9 [Iris pallida]|nr:proline-rich receptor-like protein kinase PERK9 [Iris pallida]